MNTNTTPPHTHNTTQHSTHSTHSTHTTNAHHHNEPTSSTTPQLSGKSNGNGNAPQQGPECWALACSLFVESLASSKLKVMALCFAHGRECRWSPVCCKQQWCVRRFSVVWCVVLCCVLVRCGVCRWLSGVVAYLLLSALNSDM